jgi:hypothetical protein
VINTDSAKIKYSAIIPMNGYKEARTSVNEPSNNIGKIVNVILSNFKQPIYYSFDITDNKLVPLINNLFAVNKNAHIHFPEIIDAYFQHFTNNEHKHSFFIALLVEDLLIDDELRSGIVLLVLDDSEEYLHIEKTIDSRFSFLLKDGYSPNNIAKLALILEAEEDNYKVLLPEAKTKSYEGRIWKDEFLKLKMLQDDFTFTTDYIRLTSKFIKDRIPLEEVLGKQQEVEMLNKTNEYFRENDRFDEDTFKKNIFKNNELIDAFDDYKIKWQEKNNKQLNQKFDVSDDAWLSNQKVFKSVIKLDKNFHVYVHGDHKNIVKGKDDDGRKYYKLYYENES